MKFNCLIVLTLIAVSSVAARAAPAQDGSTDVTATILSPEKTETRGGDVDQSQVNQTPPEPTVLTGPLGTKDSQKEDEEFFEEEQPKSEEPKPDAASNESAARDSDEAPDSAAVPSGASETPSNGSTEEPTINVTEAPTEVATEAPTEAPAEAPAETPAETPAEAPTEVATEAPTEAPTGPLPENLSETTTATSQPKSNDSGAPPTDNITTESPPPDTSSASPAANQSSPAHQETNEPPSNNTTESTPSRQNEDEISFEHPEEDEAADKSRDSSQENQQQPPAPPPQEPTNPSQESGNAEAKSLEPSEPASNPPSQSDNKQTATSEPTTVGQTALDDSANFPKAEDKPKLQTGPLIQHAGGRAIETPKNIESNQTVVAEHNDNKVQAPTAESKVELEQKKSNGDCKVDLGSCSAHADENELNAIVEMILNKLTSEQCAQKSGGNLKLRPATNKQVVGYVMETSSAPLEISTLAQARMTYASCVASTSSSGNSSELDQHKQQAAKSFKLRLDQELDDGYLTSSWRMYKRLAQDDLPSEVFKSLGSLKARSLKNQYRAPVVTRHSNKCQRFTIESGDYYLELLAPKTSSTFEVKLAAVGERANSSDSANGTHHTVSLLEFNVSQLYLDHGLAQTTSLANATDAQSNGLANQYPLRRQQTTQIFHTNNGHFRRNHWLLDLYANWLKHEYRTQLRRLIASQRLVDQMNVCLQV